MTAQKKRLPGLAGNVAHDVEAYDGGDGGCGAGYDGRGGGDGGGGDETGDRGCGEGGGEANYGGVCSFAYCLIVFFN